jgi:hypothetical protein
MLTSRAMIAMTTSSSIKVNARRFMGLLLKWGTGSCGLKHEMKLCIVHLTGMNRLLHGCLKSLPAFFAEARKVRS